MVKGSSNYMLLPSKNIQALSSLLSMSQINYELDYEYFNNGTL